MKKKKTTASNPPPNHAVPPPPATVADNPPTSPQNPRGLTPSSDGRPPAMSFAQAASGSTKRTSTNRVIYEDKEL
ncbi:hypothetical protein BGZ50_007679, partial [Haplosporangium sp. Z 11]